MLEAKTIDMEAILPACVKFCANHNAKIKKSACEALICCSEKFSRPDVGLLAVNILLKDVNDPNPDVRATAIDTTASLSVLAEEHSLQAISCGLKDSNPRVRKAAVIGCGKVWRHSPKIIEDNGVVDVLYTMVRDPEPSVMTFALQTINVILSNEGGVIINSSMANYLLSRLDDCQDLEKCFILDYLHKHKPKNAASRLTIMNHIDPLIGHKSGSVFLAASKLFYRIMIDDEDTRKLSADFVDRFQPQLSRFLRDAVSTDFLTALLSFIDEMSPDDVLVHLAKNHKEFRLKRRDTGEICDLKCDILTKLAGSENRDDIIKYLINQLENPSYSFWTKTALLRALCKINAPNLANELQKLMNASPDAAVPLLLKNARVIPKNMGGDKEELLRQMCEYSLTYCQPLDAYASQVLWTMCHHPKDIKNGPYILERLIHQLSEAALAENVNLLLLAGVKAFLASPAEAQPVLGCIFRICDEQKNNTMLSCKVDFYAKLLQKHSELCQTHLL